MPVHDDEMRLSFEMTQNYTFSMEWLRVAQVSWPCVFVQVLMIAKPLVSLSFC